MKKQSLESTILAYAYHIPELSGWRVNFRTNLPKRTLGECVFRPKLIWYNWNIFRVNKIGKCRQIILHELAHAIAFVRHGSTGHDRYFRKVCSELGVASDSMISVKYPKTGQVYICSDDYCGMEDWSFSRKSQNTVYCICGTKMVYYGKRIHTV